MTDPVFSIAVAGLGLSALVSAIRLFSWFLHSDPKAIAQAGRLSAVGLFALSLPLLFGLVANQKWVEAIGLSAVMLLAFAFYGPQVLGRLLPRRLVADFTPASARAADATAGYDTEMVQRSIAVLEDYLRRTTAIAAENGRHSRSRLSRISHARGHGGGNGHDDERRDREDGGQEAGDAAMAEAEALAVLGLDPEATEAEIAEQHRRLMQLIHPDRGGSPYFAVKVNQAKEALLGRAPPQNGGNSGARKRRRRASEQDLSQSKPATRG